MNTLDYQLKSINFNFPRDSFIVETSGVIFVKGAIECISDKKIEGIFIKIGNKINTLRKIKVSQHMIHFQGYIIAKNGLNTVKLIAQNEDYKKIIWKKIIYHKTNTSSAPNYLQIENILPPTYVFHRKTETINHSLIVVILHLYYFELWMELSAYISQIPYKFDLFITVPESIDKYQKKMILERFPFANIFPLKNKGRDILPFLQVCKTIDISKYQFMCKIHSKRSIHRIDGEIWRKEMLYDLLGSPKAVNLIINKLFKKDESIGLIAPWNSLVLYEHSDINKNLIIELEEKMNYTRFKNFIFPKGSMFWARVDALAPLFSLPVHENDFPKESMQIDGTYAHAIERIIGAATIKAGYQCKEIPEETLTYIQ
jgi:lipopolysaccharide biosynthesis protein